MSQHPSLQQLLDRLQRCHPQEIDLSLSRMTRLLTKLNHPERHLPPVIHVAGTNGKGSTIAFMRAMLEAGGYRVHTYTSPHLVHFHERIRLAGQTISDEALKEYLLEVLNHNQNEQLTLFEGTTAAAFLAFSRIPGDIVLLETGLGGRLDATNVVDCPILTVITPISWDHQEYLGHTLSAIALEKAGIIKVDCPVVIASQEPEVDDILCAKAGALNAPLIRLEDHEDAFQEIEKYPLGIKGAYQRTNAALAWLAIEAISHKFPLSHKDKGQGLMRATWPGRWQQITQGPIVESLPIDSQLWLDGAHNEAGIKSLIPSLKQWKEEGHPVIVGINSLKNRPMDEFIALLQPYVDHWFFILSDADHAFHSQDDYDLNFTHVTDVAHLAKNLSYWSNGSRILITGSLYLVGDILRINQTRSGSAGRV